MLLKKQELEEARARLLSVAERELIDRAKRDQEVSSIEDEDVKENLKSALENLRNEISVEHQSDEQNKINKANSLLEMAAKFRGQIERTKDFHEQEKFKKQAGQLEEKAHSMMMYE